MPRPATGRSGAWRSAPTTRPTRSPMPMWNPCAKRAPSAGLPTSTAAKRPRSPGSSETDVERALLQPHMPAAHHAGRQRVLAGVLVPPQVLEQALHLAARGPAEKIGELAGLLGLGLVVVAHLTGVADRSGHRKQLHD